MGKVSIIASRRIVYKKPFDVWKAPRRMIPLHTFGFGSETLDRTIRQAMTSRPTATVVQMKTTAGFILAIVWSTSRMTGHPPMSSPTSQKIRPWSIISLGEQVRVQCREIAGTCLCKSKMASLITQIHRSRQSLRFPCLTKGGVHRKDGKLLPRVKLSLKP